MKRNLIYLSLFALASCSTQLAAPPEPPSGSSSLSAYFWADSTATYRYQVSTTSDIHTLSIQAGGTVVDKDDDSGKTTTLTITRTGSSDAMSGFGSSDFLGLGSSLEVVQDTTLPAPRMEFIHSIAAFNPKFGYSIVYAASDSLLYQIAVNSTVLSHPNPLPVRGLTLAEDIGEGGVYAFQLGGRGIFWTSDGGAHWASDSTPAGTGITAFASSKYGGDIFWAACGGQLYEFSYANFFGKPVTCPLGTITALEATSDGVIAAGTDGNVYDVPRNGLVQPLAKAPGAILGIAGNYITTALPGIFDYTKSGLPIIAADDSAIYSTGVSTDASVFAGRSDGSVDHFSATSADVLLTAPNPGRKVTQFAYPNQGGHESTNGIYALAGGQVYYRQDSATWVPVNQTVSTPAPLTPGALTLLRTDANSWIAGYVERTYKGVQKGYGFRATETIPFAQVILDGMPYDDVLIVSFATESNGVADLLNMPQYNIYFQKGVGIIRIEQTTNGTTITTRRIQ
ncbi:MAG TPA: hypothetical protein VFH95_04855 [Candidatus Kapabacteria bacterium]|nr:hypothetical protein [Candidatus Kapabacteria bacterium]